MSRGRCLLHLARTEHVWRSTQTRRTRFFWDVGFAYCKVPLPLPRIDDQPLADHPTCYLLLYPTPASALYCTYRNALHTTACQTAVAAAAAGAGAGAGAAAAMLLHPVCPSLSHSLPLHIFAAGSSYGQQLPEPVEASSP